jgi:hypothetical protein
MAKPKPRAFVDVEVLTRPAGRGLDHVRLLHSLVLDGTLYALPEDFPVLVETTAGGPQLVTITLLAGDVRFTDHQTWEKAQAQYDEPIPVDGGISL